MSDSFDWYTTYKFDRSSIEQYERESQMATADLQAPKQKNSITTITTVDSVSVLTFRADVQPEGGGPPPTGTVTFWDGNTAITTVSLGNSFAASSMPATVHAKYNGDSKYFPSTSPTLTAPFV